MSDERVRTERSAEEDAEWRNPANWHGGPLGLYFSRRDPRAFVPKRSGIGATINFARPLGVAFLVGILGFAALMFWLSRGVSR
jgi:uncharacterized membrane protein